MFQFQCPQCANLLQADPQQAGQQSQCPICHALFVIPVAANPPVQPAPSATPPVAESSGEMPVVQASPRRPIGRRRRKRRKGKAEDASDWQNISPPESGSSARREEFPPNGGSKAPEQLHIPCPQCKQVLETPAEMLDQEVLCPQCETQFRLLRRHSLEARRQRELERKLQEQRASKMWFHWAIIAVVLVVLFLLFLLLATGA